MSKRRKFLKRSGAIAGTGIISLTAGCSSGSNNSDEAGSNSDEAGSGDLTPITATIPTWGYWTIIMQHLDEEGIIQQKMEDAGYDLSLQYTWSGSPLFASGESDITHVSPLEDARLGAEQGIDTTVSGRIVSNFFGFWVRTGSDYDPENTGSVQASMDKLVEDGGNVLIGSWAGGDIPAARISIDSEYGYEFSQEGDFNVVSASGYTVIPSLIVEGEAPVGLTSPMHGGGQYVLDDEIKPLFQFPAILEDYEIEPPLNNISVRTEFAENNPEALSAMVSAWDEGTTWFFENGTDVIQDEEDVEAIGARTMEGAEYIVEWATTDDAKYTIDSPIVYQDANMNDEYIRRMKEFLTQGEERNILPSGWEETVTFQKIQDL